MNYELAKQLKDAGFPLEYGITVGSDGKQKEWRNENIVKPTLEELIEACGDGLQSLINNRFSDGGGWVAYTNAKDSTGERMDIYGKTPSEAVAKLWLALQHD